MLVAQYWSDNAYGNYKEFEKAGDEWIKDYVNLPANLRESAPDFCYDLPYISSWYQGDVISTFSAYCKEGGDQQKLFPDNYVPYSILRRKGKEIEVEVVGEMLRPWLDGVYCNRDK